MSLKSKENANDVVTKNDVKELLEQFNHVSAKVLGHPKFEDESREIAVQHTAAYIVTLEEIIKATKGETVDIGLVPTIMVAAEYVQLVNEFCAD